VSALVRWQGETINIAALVLAATLGAGLSAMPIHAIMVLVWALPVVAICQVSPALAGSSAVWRAAVVLSTAILVAFVLAYGLATRLPALVCVAILLGSFAIGTLALLFAWLRSGTPIDWSKVSSAPVLLVLAIGAGYGIGIAFMGNIFITHAHTLLAHLWPWSGIQIADRPVSDLGTFSGKLEFSPYCSTNYWAFGTLAGHCGSLSMMVRTYGLAFAAMVGVIAWRTRYLPPDSIVPDRQRTLMLCGILACLLAMPVSFVAFDFIAPAGAPLDWERNLSMWLRSRLVEPWFYSGILLSLAFFLRDAGIRSRRWIQSGMLIAIAVGGMIPLVFLGQLVVNFVYLFQAISTRL
jgi:hypothetical protein